MESYFYLIVRFYHNLTISVTCKGEMIRLPHFPTPLFWGELSFNLNTYQMFQLEDMCTLSCKSTSTPNVYIDITCTGI